MLNVPPFVEQILVNKIDAGSTGVADCRGYPYLTVYVVGTGVTSSGVITIEEAPTPTFAGTWSSIATINASDATGGAAKASHLAVGAYAYVRARISTVIGGGGSVSVTLAATPAG